MTLISIRCKFPHLLCCSSFVKGKLLILHVQERKQRPEDGRDGDLHIYFCPKDQQIEN
jgi:hypothetical protein